MESVRSPLVDHQAVLLDEVGRRVDVREHQHAGQVLHGERRGPLGAHRVGDVQGQQSLGPHLDTRTDQTDSGTDGRTEGQRDGWRETQTDKHTVMRHGCIQKTWVCVRN